MPLPSRPTEHTRNEKAKDPSTKPFARTTLPAELWLQILEKESILDKRQLWCEIRPVSRNFMDYVERIFLTKHLPDLHISLALPRHDPTTGALRWPGRPIPRANMTLLFAHVNTDRQSVIHHSPVELLDGSDSISVATLRDSQILSKQRLQEAATWIYFSKNSLTGLSMQLDAEVGWDEEHEVWAWEMDWRRILTQFFRQKEQSSKRRNER